MEFVKTRSTTKSKIPKEASSVSVVKQRKSSASDDILGVDKNHLNVSQITLFSRRRSLSQPDLSRIEGSQQINLNSSATSNHNNKSSSLQNSVKIETKSGTLELSAIDLATVKSANEVNIDETENSDTDSKPSIYTFSLNGKKQIAPPLSSIPNPPNQLTLTNHQTLRNSTDDSVDYHKRAISNRLTLDMSTNNMTFASSSLLRNPEYRRTIAVMDANLNTQSYSPTATSPPPSHQLPVPGFSSTKVSRAPTLNPDKIMPTLDSVVMERFASFEEPSFISVDILEDEKSREGYTNNAFFKLPRSGVSIFFQLILLLGVIMSAAFLSILTLYNEYYYLFIPAYW